MSARILLDVEAMRRLRQEGLSYAEIARQLGTAPESVIRHLAVNRPKLLDVAWEPGCMEPLEVADWRAGKMPACTDCPIVFYERMLANGRCNGFPASLMRGAVDPNEQDDVIEPRRPSRRRLAP